MKYVVTYLFDEDLLDEATFSDSATAFAFAEKAARKSYDGSAVVVTYNNRGWEIDRTIID